MPKFLERKLKKQYGQSSDIPYKVMNSIGAMKGSKETAKGKAMQKKHNSKVKKSMSKKTKTITSKPIQKGRGAKLKTGLALARKKAMKETDKKNKIKSYPRVPKKSKHY